MVPASTTTAMPFIGESEVVSTEPLVDGNKAQVKLNRKMRREYMSRLMKDPMKAMFIALHELANRKAKRRVERKIANASKKANR